jgi:hypothetical protein
VSYRFDQSIHVLLKILPQKQRQKCFLSQYSSKWTEVFLLAAFVSGWVKNLPTSSGVHACEAAVIDDGGYRRTLDGARSFVFARCRNCMRRRQLPRNYARAHHQLLLLLTLLETEGSFQRHYR